MKFKPGDTVKAINKGHYFNKNNHLTVGEIYIVETVGKNIKQYIHAKGFILGFWEDSFVLEKPLIKSHLPEFL